jgi:hypothetical protein
MDKFEEFMLNKKDYGTDNGFEPLFMPDFLFDFQKHIVEWIVRKGRGAVFADCGMGKTPMQLVWAQNVVQETNKPVLILTPLAVSFQTLDEAAKFGIEAVRADPSRNPTMLQVTNYEQLHKFNPYNYAGVVCDESSILKNFKGKIKSDVTEFMRLVKYRSLWTATAAPNDWEELGTSSEALGYFGYTDMLSKFFTNKQQSAALQRGRFGRGDKWRLRGWAEKGPFWRWVCSWSTAARKPSDIGFDDDGFILPELIENDVDVFAQNLIPGMLMDVPASGWAEERKAIKNTIPERCAEAADLVKQHDTSMVWCHLNDESKMLKEMIPNAVEIKGSDSDEKREEAVRWFVSGKDEQRRLISKPKIFGFGMNFQHCNHMTYFPTHSYEQYYQSTRRLWRFGQNKPVIVDRIYTNGGKNILANLDRKARAADEMFEKLVKHMNNALEMKNTYTTIQNMEVPQWLR